MDFLNGLGGFLSFVQIFFAVVIGLYFWNLLRAQQGNKHAVEKESKKENGKTDENAPHFFNGTFIRENPTEHF